MLVEPSLLGCFLRVVVSYRYRESVGSGTMSIPRTVKVFFPLIICAAMGMLAAWIIFGPIICNRRTSPILKGLDVLERRKGRSMRVVLGLARLARLTWLQCSLLGEFHLQPLEKEVP